MCEPFCPLFVRYRFPSDVFSCLVLLWVGAGPRPRRLRCLVRVRRLVGPMRRLGHRRRHRRLGHFGWAVFV